MPLFSYPIHMVHAQTRNDRGSRLHRVRSKGNQTKSTGHFSHARGSSFSNTRQASHTIHTIGQQSSETDNRKIAVVVGRVNFHKKATIITQRSHYTHWRERTTTPRPRSRAKQTCSLIPSDISYANQYHGEERKGGERLWNSSKGIFYLDAEVKDIQAGQKEAIGFNTVALQTYTSFQA